MAEGSPAPGGRLLFNVNLLFLTQIATYALRFLLSVIIARGLGPGGRGDYALFILSTSLLASVGTMGVGLGSMYHIGKGRYGVRVLLGNSQFLVLVVGSLASLVILVLGLTIDPSAFVPLSSFWLYVLALPAMLEFLLLTALLVGQGRFVGLNVAALSQALMGLVGAAVLYALDDLTLFSLLTVWGASYLAASIIALAFLGYHNWSLRAALRPDVGALREQVGTGLPGQAGNVLQFLNYRLDQFVVRGLGTRSDVGRYAVAVGLSETVWWIANAVSMALLPRLTRMESDKGAEVAATACRNTLVLAAAAAGGLGAVAPLAVPILFGDAFSSAVRAVFWLIPGIIFLSGAKVLSSYIFSQGKMALNSVIALTTFAATLLFDFLLIPPFGIAGAAAASSIAYTLTFVLGLVFYQRLSGRSFLTCLLPRTSDLKLYMDLAKRARHWVSPGALAGGRSQG